MSASSAPPIVVLHREAPAARGQGVDLDALLGRDAALTVTMALALCLGVISVAFFAHAGLLTAYGDAQARLLIARTVVEGRHPGLAQLGGVWPPLPQVYMIPFVWNDALYYSGIAGAIPSLLSYLGASAFLYKAVARLTGDPVAGLISVVGFSGPNTLYLLSVPMSEMPFIACFVAAVYFTVSWMLSDRLGTLFAAGLAACIATLTRYEGWVLVALLIASIVAAWRRGGRRYQDLEGHLVFFSLVAFFGIALWLVWNRVIFGDVLYFLHSQYGTRAINGLQLTAMAAPDRPTWNLRLASLVFGWTALDNVGWVAAAVAGLGLVRLAVHMSGPGLVAALLLIFPVAFSIVAVYLGVEVVADGSATPGAPATNLRYGLLVAPAVGFLAGWLAQGRWLRWPVLVACTASSLLVWQGGVADANEAAGMDLHYRQTISAPAGWLHGHYDHGLVLIQRRSNENLLFGSGLPLGEIVYEGDGDEWANDLDDPAREIRWIVMDSGSPAQATPPDEVWRRLHDSPRLDLYDLVYQDGPILVYRAQRP